jgi:hypothetical protein
MNPLTFPEIASLLNRSGTTEIDLSPSQSQEGSWSFYLGNHKVHESSYPFSALYFHSTATQEDIRNAHRLVENDVTHVVYPSSLQNRSSIDLRSHFRRAKGVWTIKEYLVSFIKKEIDTYIQRLSEEKPRFYIDPRVEVPAAFSRKIPNPVLAFLRDRESDPRLGGGRLGVLLAEPGQGKTYMSRYLAARILELDKDLVPLVVNSSQWDTMALEDQRDLMKTLAHSFKHYGATIGWLHGHEDEFFRVTLKADVFRIVFDGFDEYILRNRGKVVASEVLDGLNELANSTGSRIIITSRTSFWVSSLLDAADEGGGVEELPRKTAESNKVAREDGSDASVFLILPFDQEHAKNYFRARLDTDRKRELASQTYRELNKISPDLAGRGFVLSLIARLFKDQDDDDLLQVESLNPLLWLMFALCEREQERQSLPFNSREQVEILTVFASDVAAGEQPDSELLELAMRIVKPSLDPETISATLEKLQSHPLLERVRGVDIWQFRHEQIWVALLATEIVKLSPERVRLIVNKLKIDADLSHDLASRIIDLVKNEHSGTDRIDRLKELIKAMSDYEVITSPSQPSRGARLGATLALESLDELLPKSSHLERRKLLQRLCGGELLERLAFSGTVARLDLRGTRFSKCRFERVAWANCQFDKYTTFQECRFEGMASPQYSEGFGYVQFVDCRLDPEAEAVVNIAKVKLGIKPYSVEDLRSDIDCVLRKFIAKGGVGLKSVDARYLVRGQIADSPNKDGVVEILCNTVLEGHQVAGHTKVEYKVRKHAQDDVKFYATNNILTGVLQKAYESLSQRLMLSRSPEH